MSMAAGVAGLLALGTGCDLAAPAPPSQPCGGHDDAPCPDGAACEDDPEDDCDPRSGAECPGRCEPAPCGDLFGRPCVDGQVCEDDPEDGCDPAADGECPGACTSPDPRPVVCGDGERTFVSHDQDLCAQILFICEVGWVPFYDSCGCGCEFLG